MMMSLGVSFSPNLHSSKILPIQQCITRGVRELSFITGRGAVCGGTRIFWGSQRGTRIFSVGQRGGTRIDVDTIQCFCPKCYPLLISLKQEGKCWMLNWASLTCPVNRNLEECDKGWTVIYCNSVDKDEQEWTPTLDTRVMFPWIICYRIFLLYIFSIYFIFLFLIRFN